MLRLAKVQASYWWCFIGDFNVVRSSNERKGVINGRKKREVEGFNDFIEKNQLCDVPLVSIKFTWFRPNGMAMSKLDRVLVSQEWLDLWPKCKQYVQTRQVSNQCAIIVKSSKVDLGLKSFRSIDSWLLEKGFADLVKSKWNAYKTEREGLVRCKEKFKMLKHDLKI